MAKFIHFYIFYINYSTWNKKFNKKSLHIPNILCNFAAENKNKDKIVNILFNLKKVKL